MRGFTDLAKTIRNTVRTKAKEISVFRETGNGAIRILGYPLCAEADEWLGGLSDFSGPALDIADYEFVFAISPGGSRVINVVENGHKAP